MKKNLDNIFIGNSYHFSQILFHWIIALLVIYQLIFGNKIEFLELEVCKNSAINTLKSCQYLNTHYIMGVLIFSFLSFINFIRKKFSGIKEILAIIIVVIVFILLWADLAVGIFGSPFAGN